MKPEEISKLAEKERIKQDKKKTKIPRQKIRVEKTISPESWKIYKHIHPGTFHVFFWFFIVFTLAIVFLVVYFSGDWDLALPIGLSLLALFTIRMIIFQTVKIFSFFKYKNWRKTLNYKLIGWDNLGTQKKFPKAEHWDLDVELKINVKEPVPVEAAKTLKDALFLLNTKANKCFYELNFSQSGFSGDIRHRWKFIEAYTVAGSADSSVLGQIYECLNKHIRTIQEKWSFIESVMITFSNRIYHMKSPDVPLD